MNPEWLDLMQRRAARVRANARVRDWEYRQRHHAKGAWLRLRRTLTDASRALAISEAQAAKLVDRGATPLAVGHELHPVRTLLWVTAAGFVELGEVREVPMHLSSILREPFLVLLPMSDGH
jgi:hypothetical protein